MLRLYDFLDSGNGYKVRLLLTQLGIPYDYVEVDILSGKTRTPDFLSKNANGRIPLLELEDGSHLAESNAILFYLGEGTPMVPQDRWQRAQALQWMFFEQYSHEPNIATARFLLRHTPADDPRRSLLPAKKTAGEAALAVMDRHLGSHPWFVGGRYGVADIALYAYTHVADEGGFDLQPYRAVVAWLERVRDQPHYKPITSR